MLFQPGLFGQIGRELNFLGNTVSRAVDKTADEINKSFATTATGQVLVRISDPKYTHYVCEFGAYGSLILTSQNGCHQENMSVKYIPT